MVALVAQGRTHLQVGAGTCGEAVQTTQLMITAGSEEVGKSGRSQEPTSVVGSDQLGRLAEGTATKASADQRTKPGGGKATLVTQG